MRKVNFLVYVYSFVLFLISPPYFLWGTQIPVLLVIFYFYSLFHNLELERIRMHIYHYLYYSYSICTQ